VTLLRVPSALVLALLTLAPAVVGAQPTPERNAAELSVLEYHPYPDDRDPLGVPAGNTSGGPADRMAAYYGASWFPTVHVDGVLSSANEPGEQVDDPEGTYAGMVEERLTRGSPATIRLDGRLGAEAAQVNVTVEPRTDVASSRVVLRVVLFEDGVEFSGGNGIRVHPFTVRAVDEVGPVPVEPGQVTRSERRIPLNASWDRGNLGAGAFLQNEDDRQSLAAKEVVQSASLRFAQTGPTVQRTKAPLMEVYTAAWCDPCAPADVAVRELARRYGASAGAADAGYLVEPDLTRLAVGGLAGLVLAAGLIPRGGRRR
jgi:hypothetical protein